jgi:hypothetical protein
MDIDSKRDRPVDIEVTPAMIDAARLALIDWYDGDSDFPEGVLGVISAAFPGAKIVHLNTGSLAGPGKSLNLHEC